ncbi:hypothetical protein OROGR_022706 [Orobanche gracilis]
MEAAMDANAPLDYVEFHVVPSQNSAKRAAERFTYEAWVCYENKKGKVSSGLLEHLLLHSPEIKALHSKGSNAKYKLCAPENSHDIKWFTKTTLIRFLHIVGSPDILHVTNSMKNEITQLEEARKFHLSLYAKDSKYPLQSGESDGSCSEGTGSTTKDDGADASKSELLRAMDVRLTALVVELTTAFDQAAGLKYSVEEMIDIHKFSQHFGSKDFSDLLHKYVEMQQRDQAVQNMSSSSKHFLENNKTPKGGNSHKDSKSLSSETQVIYGASPAKATQIERQCSKESRESSFSSDEDGLPSVERSRTLIRLASPRRSASPMRRVQIGRSGSRRSTAITVKSLNYFPSRERSFFPKDEDDSGEEGPTKSENNVRMSVQDAINLFESKQRDQREDKQKAKSLMKANKSVLRRWSSGTGEHSSRSPQDSFIEGTVIQNDVKDSEVRFSSPGIEAEPIEACEEEVKLEPLENEACSPALMQEESHPIESTDVNEKSNASAEWSRQKEAELNELFMKMMETKPVKTRTVLPASSKRQSLPSEQRGGFSDHYEEKWDEKHDAQKKMETAKQFRLTLDVKKSKPTSTNDDSKKCNVKKLQKPQKSSVSQLANPKTDRSPRLGNVKKHSPKESPLPATRKSWSLTPSARATGLSPARTPPPTSAANATPTRRRSESTPPVSRSSSKVEKSQTRAKSVKSHQNDSTKSLQSDSKKKRQPLTNPKKTAKSETVQTASKDLASSTKPKITKKSSVVPLEAKPFLRKGSKTNSSANPPVTKKESPPHGPLRESEELTLCEENVISFNPSEPVTHKEEKEIEELKIHADMESEPTPTSPQKCEDEGFTQISPPITDDAVDLVVEPELKAEAGDELTISPRAWVEMEKNENQPITTVDPIHHVEGSSDFITPVELSNSRVRHSLSQMLLEQSSEPDFVDWGNAENPPPTAYQKDAPKGLKRLLKFARKSKNDANANGGSSPSVISEGEDDGDDSKLTSKRSADNLLKKATLHSMTNGHQKSSTDYECQAQSNISKHNAQSSSQQQYQQGHVSASVTTTKATRSFFSLSAFKSSK